MSGARRCGQAIAAAASELDRGWRSGRSGGRRATPAGHLDALVEPFLTEAGKALAAGREPDAAWQATAGVLRLGVGDREAEEHELDREWTLVAAAVGSACETMQSDADVRAWLAAAVDAGREGTRALAVGEPHGGIVVVWTWPPRRAR